MDKYPNGSQVLVLINLEKTANVTIGFYGDKSADFEIERNCLEYIEKLAYADEDSPDTKIQPNVFKLWDCSIQGFAFICVKNLTKDTLSLKLTVKDPKNVKPAPPYAI